MARHSVDAATLLRETVLGALRDRVPADEVLEVEGLEKGAVADILPWALLLSTMVYSRVHVC